MSKRRWLWALAPIGVAGALAAAAGPIARALVERGALRAGVELRGFEVELGWGSAVLRDVTFRLEDAPSARGRADEIRIALDGLTPRKVEARSLTVAFSGEAGRVVDELARFAERRAAAGSEAPPLSADRADLSLYEGESAPPWIAAAGPLEWGPAGGRLRADRTLATGRELGPVVIAWTVGSDGIAVGLGAEDPAKARVRAHAARHDGGVDLELAWDPLPLAAVPLPDAAAEMLRGASVAGKLSLRWPVAETPRPIHGHLVLDLSGFVPPHSKDLDGIVFGDKSRVTLDLHLDETRERARLDAVELAAGALALRGKGSAARVREGGRDEATVDLDLAGAIPCTSLSVSVVTARLGKIAGGIAGELARRTLEGSIAVTARVHADTRARPPLQIEPSARAGCRLRAL